MEYISIKNWEKYQHYANRNPPWIKLYHALLDDYDYGRLSDENKLLYLTFLMLAAKTDNNIPCDVEWIKHKSMIKGKINLDFLLTCGFIYKTGDASNTLAHDDSTRREEKRREEKKKEYFILLEKLNINNEWENFKKHRVTLKAKMTPYAEELMLKKLELYFNQGYNPVDMINLTIEKGWKDIKLEWLKKEFK
jgi:hypothetical protein